MVTRVAIGNRYRYIEEGWTAVVVRHIRGDLWRGKWEHSELCFGAGFTDPRLWEQLERLDGPW